MKKMKDSAFLDGLIGSMEKATGEKPEVMSVEVEKIEEAPVEDSDVKGDKWPVVKEALESIKGQLDSLEKVIQDAYYPHEKKEEPHNPGFHGPKDEY